MADAPKGINASIHAPKANTAESVKNLCFSKEKEKKTVRHTSLYPLLY
jgi:hypothetical protein